MDVRMDRHIETDRQVYRCKILIDIHINKYVSIIDGYFLRFSINAIL